MTVTPRQTIAALRFFTQTQMTSLAQRHRSSILREVEKCSLF